MIFLIDRATADVSSTAIRHRIGRSEPIDGLVPPLVQQHIERHGLYAPASHDAGDHDEARRRAAGELHAKE